MSKGKREKDITIDYEKIDVTDIMLQIKRKIASEPKKPHQEFGASPPIDSPVEFKTEVEVPGIKGKIKKLLLKIMRPFSPLIKLMVLPVHEEIMETNRNLHWANMRLDAIDMRLNDLEGDLGKTMEYTKLLHNLSHNIVVEISKLKIEEENLRQKAQIIEKDFKFLTKKENALEKEIFK